MLSPKKIFVLSSFNIKQSLGGQNVENQLICRNFDIFLGIIFSKFQKRLQVQILYTEFVKFTLKLIFNEFFFFEKMVVQNQFKNSKFFETFVRQ